MDDGSSSSNSWTNDQVTMEHECVPEVESDQASDAEFEPVASHEAKFSVGNTRIRPGLLRGIHMSTLLQNSGAMLRNSPFDLPVAAREKAWHRSEPCEILDAFVSQSWSSPGWQKYFTLLLRFYWVSAVTAGLVTLALFGGLDGLGWLPRMKLASSTHVGLDGSYGDAGICPWSVVPPIVALATLFCSPYLPGLPDRTVFLDAACINQVDEELKTEGVYSLAGFVASSKELIVLWCPSYLHRAWCAFELAVFAAVHGQDFISFIPLFESTVALIIYVSGTALTLVNVAMDVLPIFREVGLTAWLHKAVRFLLVSVFVHKLRSELQAIFDLIPELEHFSLDNTACRSDVELDFIKRNIDAFYGSKHKFDTWVRYNLRNAVIGSRSRFEVNYLYCLCLAFPEISYSVQIVMSFVRAGLSSSDLVSAIAGHSSMSFCVMPIFVKLIFLACRKCGKQYRNVWKNIGRSLAISSIISALFWFVRMGCIIVTKHVSLGGLPLLGVWSSFCYVIFHPGRTRGASSWSPTACPAASEVETPSIADTPPSDGTCDGDLVSVTGNFAIFPDPS